MLCVSIINLKPCRRNLKYANYIPLPKGSFDRHDTKIYLVVIIHFRSVE